MLCRFLFAPAFLLITIGSVAQSGESPAAALMKAGQQITANELPAAEATLQHLLQTDPANAQANFLLGTVLFRLKQPEASLATFTAGAHFANPDTAQLITVASDYVLLNDLADAEHWLTYATGKDPGSAEAWYLLGRTRYNLDHNEEAVTAFERVLALRPRDLKAEYNRGLAQQRLHAFPQAEASFRQAIAWQAGKTIQDPQPWLDLGLLLLTQDGTQPGTAPESKAQQALVPLQQAARFGPANPYVQQQLGVCLESLGRYPEAVAALSRAAVLAPNAGQPHFLLGRVYRHLGHEAKAKQEFNEVERLFGLHGSVETPNPETILVPSGGDPVNSPQN